MAVDWSAIKSRKILDAFRTVLSDDKRLSHSEVVEVIHRVLDDGNLSGEEISDLSIVAITSVTMMLRPRLMLAYLCIEACRVLSYGPINFSTSQQKYAADILCKFLKRKGQPYFPSLKRDRVGIDLLMRVSNPHIINQHNTSLCGPVSFLYSLAFDSPASYAQLGIKLYEMGRAKIGRIDIEPSSDCRHYSPPAPMSHGDWLLAGSLRDSEKWFFDYDSVEASGGSTNTEVADWFKRAGYTHVRHDDNLIMNRDAGDIARINTYYNEGYRVLLKINSKLLDKDRQTDSSYRGNHFVVLRSPITVTGQTVRLTVYTWGVGQWNIPAPGTQLSPGGFLEHWYGYVAAKPF